MLHIRIIPLSNEIQSLEKQKFVNFFVKNLNTRQSNRNLLSIFYALSKSLGIMHTSLANQTADIFTCKWY